MATEPSSSLHNAALSDPFNMSMLDASARRPH